MRHWTPPDDFSGYAVQPDLLESLLQPKADDTKKQRKRRYKAIKKVAGYRRLFLDFETWSEISLPDVGADEYAAHETTEVLMLAYAIGDSKVYQWKPLEGEPFPKRLRRWLADPTVLLSAWNAPFEMAIFKNTLGMDLPIERWRCTMAMAASLSLPLKLEKAGEVIGLPADKQKMSRGTALVRKFTMPRKATAKMPWLRATEETDPEDWAEFLTYNRVDIEAERAIYRRIRAWDMPGHEWGYWVLDQKINQAGIPINRKMVQNAMKLRDSVIGVAKARLKELTGLANPNSRTQILPWLRENGYAFEDLKKGHVEQALDRVSGDTDDKAERKAKKKALKKCGEHYLEVLKLRQICAKTSLSKYEKMLGRSTTDGNARGCFQFAGAGRTWRWSGRGHQPQNPPRPEKWIEKDIPMYAGMLETWSVEEWLASDYTPIQIVEILVGCIRPATQAPPGYLLIDADLNAIENRVLGWLAKDKKILSVFSEGRCPYVDFATRMFKKPYAELWAEYQAGNKEKRTIAKPGVLGCGYMLSAGVEKENPTTGEIEATGLLGYARNMHVNLTSEMSAHSVDTFRQTFTDVVHFWGELDRAVRRVIRTGRAERVGYLRIDMQKPFLRIVLPSGRALHYVRPKLEDWKMPWKDRAGKPVFKESITYENMETGRWKRVSTHPGKLAENVTQAVARDLLAHGMQLAWARGADLRMHVHDQIVAISKEAKAVKALKKLIGDMSARPWWADRKLPLAADGFTSPVFLKD